MNRLFQQLTRGNAIYLITVLGIGGYFPKGYHSVGLSSPSPFIQSFINSSWISRYGEVPPPNTVTKIWSLIVSMFAVGGVFGAPSAKFMSSKVGRKKTMMCSSGISVVAAVMIWRSKQAESFEMIVVARVLQGFSSGMGLSAQLLYLGELAPKMIRGMVMFTDFHLLGKFCGRFFGLREMGSFLQKLTQGNALGLIVVLGVGGNYQSGYHIAGLSSPSPFIQGFVNSSWLSHYGEVPPSHVTTAIWSLIVSVLALGGVLGVASARVMSSMLGRRRAIMFSSCIAVVAAVVLLTGKKAESFEMLIVARVLQGFSAGLGSSTHLLFLGELSPKNIRGTVTFTSNTFHCLGKLTGQLFGLSEILGRDDTWHVLLCVPACLSVVNILLLPLFPEAPRYLLIEKGDVDACKKALQTLWGPGDYKEEMEEMQMEQAVIEAAPPKSPLQLLRSRGALWPLLTLFLIVTCNQMSGMSIISTFSYDIFSEAGLPTDKIRYVTLGIGAVEISTSLFGGFLIDKAGRRPLFSLGYGLTAVIWVFVTVTVHFQDYASWVPYLTFIFVVAVLVSFCMGPGGSANTLNSEIFIQSERMAAVVLVGTYRWFMYAVMGLVFPFLLGPLGSYCYLLFSCFCCLGCLYTFLVLPETKGKSVLEISKEFGTISLCGGSSSKHKETFETAL